MGGIRKKARGSTVDLIIEDENSGNSELPFEVGEDMNNKLCPPFSLSYINKVSNQPIPVESNGGNPLMPKAKMGPQLIRSQLWDGLNSLRKLFSDVADPDCQQRFSLRELEIATDYFSSKNIVGTGGSSQVYKGRLADGSLVAVKRMKEDFARSGKLQFQNEVQMIGKAVHRNLLQLRGFCMTRTELGFCMTRTERLLVYPYMASGSLASCLRERRASQPPLDWPTRKRIALGSAKGLSHLHEDCGSKIIHRDVKPSNILLDEEFEAVVGDFGLAILMDCKETRVMVDRICGSYGHAKLMDCRDTSISSMICGTRGYVPPEYLSGGRCSEKNDVYGYGIVLLELITGQRPLDMDRGENDGNVHLKYWVERMLKEGKLERVVDSDLDDNYVEAEVEQLSQVALLCTQDSPMDRPKMSEVVRMLECDGLAERWNEWRKTERWNEWRKAEDLRQKVELVSHLSSDWIDESTETLQTVELSDPNEPSEWRKAEVLSQEVELVSHSSSDWIVESTETLQAVELSDPSEPSEWRKAEVLSQEVELVSHPSYDWIVESTETLQAVELSDPSEPSEWRKAEVLRQEVVLPPHPHPNVDSDWVRFFILMGYFMAVKDFATRTETLQAVKLSGPSEPSEWRTAEVLRQKWYYLLILILILILIGFSSLF